jgi:hypothetical protein
VVADVLFECFLPELLADLVAALPNLEENDFRHWRSSRPFEIKVIKLFEWRKIFTL